jgi:hypothetical protein
MTDRKRQCETSFQQTQRIYEEMQNQLKTCGFFEVTTRCELAENGECRITIRAGKNFQLTIGEHEPIA